MAAASALLLTFPKGESPSPSSPRRAEAASASWRVPPRVYSPFRARARVRHMAVPAVAEEVAAARTGRAWLRLFRARPGRQAPAFLGPVSPAPGPRPTAASGPA